MCIAIGDGMKNVSKRQQPVHDCVVSPMRKCWRKEMHWSVEKQFRQRKKEMLETIDPARQGLHHSTSSSSFPLYFIISMSKRLYSPPEVS